MSRIIKRYGNRKLYDAEAKKHISLEEIAELVRKGEDVRVIDNTTDEDITVQTLTQVIFEEGKKGRNPLSPDVLHDVIRWGNHMLDDSLKQFRDSFEKLDQIMPESLNKLFKKNEKESEIEQLKKRLESLESLITNLGSQINSDQPKKEK
ncbi:MAG: polyhydroxyalkanoate synthesis regulator DNA-binding domain-containing protein [Calditrichaeota bacterium]|nr:polyhydroxyalkanoate synthesis regulator DNA-binding domain-containing protein [Calditrichota bacterium]MCB0269176.1 polyhydroxyalkanoate synthesis regulator DNA-binding domain-containing protein [Calditrichota bacterium]